MMASTAGGTEALIKELERLAFTSEVKGFEIEIDTGTLSVDEQRLARLLTEILKNCQTVTEYELEKYRLTNDVLGIAHWDMIVMDGDPVAQGNEFHWSEEFRRMLGFTDEKDFPDVLSSWSNSLHPDDRDKVLEAFAAHINDTTGKTPYNLEYRLQTRSGEYHHFRAVGATMRDATGKPLRVAGALEDITERMEQQALRIEEEKKRRIADEQAKLMLDATPMACRLWNRNLELIGCNEAAVKLFEGVSKEEYIRRYYEFIPELQPNGEQTSDVVISALTRAFEQGYHREEMYYQKADGTPIPSDIILVRVPYQDDYVVAVYSRDLREHKRMLADIEQRDVLLQTVNQAADILLRSDTCDFEDTLDQCMGMMAVAIGADRMRVIKNETVDGVLCRSQIHTWCMRKCAVCVADHEEHTPYTETIPCVQDRLLRGEGVNSQVSTLPSPDKEWFVARGLQAIMLVPVVIHDTLWGFVEFDKCKSNTPFSVEEESIMHSGGLLIVNALLRNDSMLSIQETSSQLEIALDDAREANDAKSNFLAQMSHEIRTPLNAVVGLSELALSDDRLEEETADRLEKIHGSGMTILSIINDILDISKIESGRYELYDGQYDTPSLINDVISLNIVRIGEKPLEFKLVVDENLPGLLFGDDLRVKQIFNNLLSNAFKYTDAGSVEWHIDFERDGDDIWIISQIIDTGIGIEQEDLKKLFSDYSQVGKRTGRKAEGTGLGLSITKRLIEMMGGTIVLESRFGQGTTVSVRFRQTYVSSAAIGRSVAESLMSLNYTLSKRADSTKLSRIDLSYAAVLIVDDIATNLDVVRGMLKPYKLKVECASSGRQAIEMVCSGNTRYSAIFMDHMMPGMDGIEATKVIREDLGTEYAANIPVIALTANAIVGNEEMFLSNGFQAFISKPIDMAKLDAVLRRWVRDRDKETELLEAKVSAVSGEAGDSPAVQNGQGVGKSYFAEIEIDGMDKDKALRRFADDDSTLLDVLRSYHGNTSMLLDELRESLFAERLRDYAIAVHGIKGSSLSIFADEVGGAAEKLEVAAMADDDDTVRELHEAFERTARTFLENIGDALARIDALIDKPVVASPDPDLLDELREACRDFDIHRVDEAMRKLDGFSYKTGRELLDWLHKRVDDMDFEEISDGRWPFG